MRNRSGRLNPTRARVDHVIIKLDLFKSACNSSVVREGFRYLIIVWYFFGV